MLHLMFGLLALVAHKSLAADLKLQGSAGFLRLPLTQAHAGRFFMAI